jgi:hypothetical protein
MVGFKDNLAKHIDIVNTDSKYVMLFKCSEQLFKTDQPVFFGVVYIPPEYTKYSSEYDFSELQQEYLSFSNKSKYICLLGDFNVRTQLTLILLIRLKTDMLMIILLTLLTILQTYGMI